MVITSRPKGQATPLLCCSRAQDVSWDNPNSGAVSSCNVHPGSGPSEASEPGQLHGDPRLRANELAAR